MTYLQYIRYKKAETDDYEIITPRRPRKHYFRAAKLTLINVVMKLAYGYETRHRTQDCLQ